MLDCAVKVNDALRVAAFTAQHQIAALHNPEGHHKSGRFILARSVPWDKKYPWQQKTWSVEQFEDASAQVWPDEQDVYVSMASFFGWKRRVENLARIGTVWADLDYQKRAAWKDKSPEFVLESLKYALKDRGIPFPTWVMATGRGLCIVWLHSWIPNKALPRWTAIQKRLAEALADYGADKGAIDAARVFRLAGSRNSRAIGNSSVRAIYVNGDPKTLRAQAWDFDTLALEMLPVERAELRSLQAERAKRRADRDAAKPPSPATNLTWASYGEAILVDLHRLRHLRHGGGRLPPGQRDEWLFVASCAMAHFSPPAVLKREIVALSAEVSGWSEREAKSNMGAVIRRAIAAADGLTVLGPDGRQADPRYTLRTAAIIDRLEITPAEMRSAGLRVLVDADRRRELNTRRTRESRQARGATPRSMVQAERLALGHRALARKAQGETIEAIARDEGVSPSHVSKSIAAARKKDQ